MNDATDFPIGVAIAHDDRSRTNSIRVTMRSETKSLPAHARAYRAGSPFSTFQREGSGTNLVPEKLCVFLSSAYTCWLKHLP